MAPKAVRAWRNTSEEHELLFIAVQTKENALDNAKPTSDGIALKKEVKW